VETFRKNLQISNFFETTPALNDDFLKGFNVTLDMVLVVIHLEKSNAPFANHGSPNAY